MAEIGDVAQRLADGMPAVLTIQQYVAACAYLGYHHPDLTVHAAQLRDWYGSEDGMDLEALLNDCLALEAAASAADEALEVQDRQRAALPGMWQGAGAGASVEFLSRHSVASAAVAAALRTASQALTGLREKLWNAVDSKVEAVIGIEDRVAATRAEWSAAAVTVTTGAGDRAVASELVDQSVKPFVDTAIRTDWLTAMRVAMSTVTTAYQRATAEIAGERLPDFAIPGDLGPVWSGSGDAPRGERLDDGPRAPAPVPGPASGGIAPTFGPAPATAPAAWSAPPGSAPADILAPPREAPAIDAGMPPTLPSSGMAGPGVPGLDGAGGLAGLGQPFADALSGLLGGGGGNSLPEPGALDVPELGGDEDQHEDQDDDEDRDEDEEEGRHEDDEEEAATEDPGKELNPDAPADPDADEPESDPDVAPAPTPPPPPPPAEPLPPAADTVGEDRTPCEIAADELPQVGEPQPNEPGGG